MMIAEKMCELEFTKLMEIYIEGNVENGRECYPDDSAFEQLRLAEEDFRRYLTEDFFTRANARYFILDEQGAYISALRTEPYMDGVLLQALETRPDMRRKGNGKRLVSDALSYLKKIGITKVYSHISKKNTPSLRTHKACGFQIIAKHAVYIDGTVSANALTLCAEI